MEDIPFDAKLEPLSLCAFTIVIDITSLTGLKWPEHNGGTSMSNNENWIVRTHALAYVLHVINRLTFMAGGESLRNKFQDYYTFRLIQSLVESSWVKPDGKEDTRSTFLRNVFDNTLENINECEMHYGEFPKFLSRPELEHLNENHGALIPNKDDIMHCLTEMIAVDTNMNLTPEFQQMIMMNVMKAIGDNGLIDQISVTTKIFNKSDEKFSNQPKSASPPSNGNNPTAHEDSVVKYCAYCGTTKPVNNKYCTQCGKSS